MADDEHESGRIERMVGGGRDFAVQAADEVAERVGRVWSSVRSRGSDSDDASDDGDQEARLRADPAALFSLERQREVAKLGHANILVIGQTGVGKSTLVNAVFGKELARTGTGRPVTKAIERFADPDVPVTLYDTKGVELGDSKKQLVRDFKHAISKARRGPEEEHIHLVWYCIDAGQTRVQDWDIDIITALADDVPVVLVLTQTIDDQRADELEATAQGAELPVVGGRAVRTLAMPRTIGGTTLPSRGLEELVLATDEALPEAVRRAFASAQQVVLDLKRNQARAVVAGATAAPLPTPAAASIQLVQVGMLAGITAVFGMAFSNDQMETMVKGVMGGGGIEQVGKAAAKQLAKYVPGANVVNAAVAASVTAGLGEAYIRLCSEVLRRQAAGKPMPSADMLGYLMSTYKGLLSKPGAEPQLA